MTNWAMMYCDQRYRRNRDALISMAVRFADDQTRVKRGQKITRKERQRRVEQWNKLYHTKMNELSLTIRKENGNGKRG